MAFENEQIKDQDFSQNINETEKKDTNPTDNNVDNNNPPPPPDVNENGDVVKLQTQSIQVGSSAVYMPSSHEELDELVSEKLITEKHKSLFVLKYEDWHGELPKTKLLSPKKEKREDKKIDLNALFPELQNQSSPEENTQPKIDLNVLRQEEKTEKQSKGGGNVPNALKTKIEKASEVPLDDVTIHYNSQEPFKYEANAFAKGNEVFLAPGQEEHLSEELWHIVQQKQDLVRPTSTENGTPINDTPNLERLAKKGQSETGGKEEEEKQQEVIQKNDDKLTFVIKEPNTSQDTNEIDYEDIDWNSIDKSTISIIKKGQKLSVYAIASKLKWPKDKTTHSHIIRYIKNAAKEKGAPIIDKNYVLAPEKNFVMEIPKFRPYVLYFKNHSEPKFQKFHEEHLTRYTYPPLILGLEKEIEKTIVTYKNPATSKTSQTPVSQTLYGGWLIHRINTAKDFFDSHGTIEGFEYSILEGQPQPTNSALIMDNEDGWYSKEAWSNLDWDEKIDHFEKGLDERLQKNEGGIRQMFKQMQKDALANGQEINSEYLPKHNEEGDEIYSFREQVITYWEEDEITSSGSIIDKTEDLKYKVLNIKNRLKENSSPSDNKELELKLTAYQQQVIALQAIRPIFDRWEQVDYTPTETDIKIVKQHKKYLKHISVAYYHPNMSSLIKCKKAVENYFPPMYDVMLDLDAEIAQINKLIQVIIQIQSSVDKHTREKTTPSLEEWQQYQELETLLADYNFPKVKYDFTRSILRGDYLINKYCSTKKAAPPPPHIQYLIDGRNK